MISVIVPFHDAQRHLPSLLESLTAQVIDGPWEVIAVDNRSTDDSRVIVESFRSRLPLTVVTAGDRSNPSYARNVGARAAAGDTLLFVDADDELAPGYVAAMAGALRHHEFVTSRVDSEALNPEWVRAAHGEAWQSERVGVFFHFLPAAGPNVGISRPAFERVGGFPEEFSGSEDIAFSWIAQQKGLVIHFVPGAVYRYRYRDSLPRLFRQTVNWGRDNVLLYRRFRSSGMPARPMAIAWREWWAVMRGLALAKGRTDRSPFVVRLGFCAGRVHGSLRHRTLYL